MMIKDQSISKGDLVNYRREQIVFNPTGSHHYINITTPAIVLATYKQDPALPWIQNLKRIKNKLSVEVYILLYRVRLLRESKPLMTGFLFTLLSFVIIGSILLSLRD